MATKKGAGSFALATFAPMPDLKLALAGLVDGRESEMTSRLGISHDKMSKMGVLVRDASVKHGRCVFCGRGLPAEFKKAAKIGWTSLRPLLCGCLAEVREGYHEYFPHWRERVQVIHDQVVSRQMPTDQPIYSDRCNDTTADGQPCATVFTVYAGDIQRNVARHGRHEKWSKCEACRNRRAKEKQAAEQRKQTQPQQQPQQQPNAKQHAHAQKKNAKYQGQRPRAFAPLKTTVAEQLAAKQVANATTQPVPDIADKNFDQQMQQFFGKPEQAQMGGNGDSPVTPSPVSDKANSAG